MQRALVIADDLSGAAEIAGIGLRFGLPTQLALDRAEAFHNGLTVIDSDSRSLDCSQAADRVRRLVAGVDPYQFDLLYKKTDSAVRGNILAEVGAIQDSFRVARALLVPQNPSRGRTIVAGEYRIGGVPLHETSFAHDPAHPATCSDVADLLGDPRSVAVRDPRGSDDLSGITVGCAADAHDVRFWAERVTRDILPAGGADFFTAILESRGLRPTRDFVRHLHPGRDLFVCGSASAYRDELVSEARKHNFAICPMPDDVFKGGDAIAWHREVVECVSTNQRTLVAIQQPLEREAGGSARLQLALCELVASALASIHIDHLFLEGGATASAVCRRMTWTQLEVIGELATGVVQLRATDLSGPQIFIKPGSYPWPDSVIKS